MFVIWVDLLAREGYVVEDVLKRLLQDLENRHSIVGWGYSPDNPTGVAVEIELGDDSEDTAVRRSLLQLAESTIGVERLELLDRDPLDPPA
jgi:hypothetical protein